MKRLSKFLAIMAAAGMTAGIMASTAYADNAEAVHDYVYVAVEKFTIGQGYVFAPEKVPLQEGDTGLDVLKRAVGEDNIIGSGEQWGYYIEGFKDVDAGDVTLAKCISAVVDKSALTDRNTEGVLSSFDYTAESGFIFFLNNRSSDTAIDSYAPSDGDVIRIQYSIYGYGSDIGIDNSSWGGTASVIPETNRDALTALIAEALDEGVDCTDAIAVISNMDSTQEQLDTAYSALEIALTPQVSDENTENDSASTEQQDQQTENNSAVTEEQDQQTESNDKTPATGASAKLLFIPVCSAIAALIISGKSRFSEN